MIKLNKKLKLNSDQVNKFNEKVRKANSKLIKRKKSKGRRTSRDHKPDQSRSKSRNESLTRLKNRKLKHITQSNHITDLSSEHEDNYNPKEREIGMDFLEFVKKKPNKSNTKLFLSTQKTGSDWGKSYRLEKSKGKIRPNSAQNAVHIDRELRALDEILYCNGDLEQHIEPIDEQPDENHTNRVSDELYVLKDKSQEEHPSNNFEPLNKMNVRITPKHISKNKIDNNHINIAKDYYSKEESTNKKKKSRSKVRKNTYSEERKDRKSHSIESKNDSKKAKNFKNVNAKIRPFSGGQKKLSKNNKIIKNTKIRQRPKTAKTKNKKIENEPKSPASNKVISPKSSMKKLSKKSRASLQKNEKGDKSKTVFSNVKRKASMSPSAFSNKNMTLESGNTFARATNQNEILDYMIIQKEKAMREEDAKDERIRKVTIEKEDIKINNYVEEQKDDRKEEVKNIRRP